MSATALLYAILSGVLPSFIWLFFWLREDRQHPEPRSLLVACFFGGILAVGAAAFSEQYVADIYSDSTTRYILWAAIEEILKFIAIAAIGLRSLSNDEPIDAMIYCIVVAIGFAALENTLFIMDPLAGGEIARSIVTGNMRFMGATLLHIVSSATIGFCIGYFFYHGRIAKIIAAVVGIAIAITIHAAFNFLFCDPVRSVWVHQMVERYEVVITGPPGP
jgi:RsiW-degrading membrane proteinase PrsW (M82 family)